MPLRDHIPQVFNKEFGDELSAFDNNENDELTNLAIAAQNGNLPPLPNNLGSNLLATGDPPTIALTKAGPNAMEQLLANEMTMVEMLVASNANRSREAAMQILDIHPEIVFGDPEDFPDVIGSFAIEFDITPGELIEEIRFQQTRVHDASNESTEEYDKRFGREAIKGRFEEGGYDDPFAPPSIPILPGPMDVPDEDRPESRLPRAIGPLPPPPESTPPSGIPPITLTPTPTPGGGGIVAPKVPSAIGGGTLPEETLPGPFDPDTDYPGAPGLIPPGQTPTPKGDEDVTKKWPRDIDMGTSGMDRAVSAITGLPQAEKIEFAATPEDLGGMLHGFGDATELGLQAQDDIVMRRHFGTKMSSAALAKVIDDSFEYRVGKYLLMVVVPYFENRDGDSGELPEYKEFWEYTQDLLDKGNTDFLYMTDDPDKEAIETNWTKLINAEQGSFLHTFATGSPFIFPKSMSMARGGVTGSGIYGDIRRKGFANKIKNFQEEYAYTSPDLMSDKFQSLMHWLASQPEPSWKRKPTSGEPPRWKKETRTLSTKTKTQTTDSAALVTDEPGGGRETTIYGEDNQANIVPMNVTRDNVEQKIADAVNKVTNTERKMNPATNNPLSLQEEMSRKVAEANRQREEYFRLYGGNENQLRANAMQAKAEADAVAAAQQARLAQPGIGDQSVKDWIANAEGSMNPQAIAALGGINSSLTPEEALFSLQTRGFV